MGRADREAQAKGTVMSPKKEAKPSEPSRPTPDWKIPDCPKCGCRDPWCVYEQPERLLYSVRYPLDVLRLKCRRCAYVWRIPPKDANERWDRR